MYEVGFSPADQMSPSLQTHNGDLVDLVDLVFGACPLRIRRNASFKFPESLPSFWLSPSNFVFTFPPPDSETSLRLLLLFPFFFSFLSGSPISRFHPLFSSISWKLWLRAAAIEPKSIPFTMADAKKPAVLIIGGLGT